jgi:rhomboid protease GluP
MGRLALVFGAGCLSISSPAAHRTNLPFIIASELALLCIITVGAQVRLRLRGGAPPIILSEDGISLPRHALSLRTTCIDYADIRSASLAGRGDAERIVIETTRRSFRFPRASFAQPDGLGRLRQALGARILAMPGGGKRWAAIEARHNLADRLAAIWPWGTWAAVVAIIALFGLQTLLVRGIGDFGLIDLGGNASLLVRDGEWFRLVTASLLHENARHLVGNALVLLLVGGILEPLIGSRQFLLVLLASCVASQVVSAWVGLHYGDYVYAIGISGGLYGLVGALAAVTLRFGTALPGGYRLPMRAWAYFAVSVLVLPFFVRRVDHAAHIGGFACGLLLGLVLLRDRARLHDIALSRALPLQALYAAAFVWIAGLGFALVHETSLSARTADHYALASDMLNEDHFPPASRNSVAWAIARDPLAPAEVLDNARRLARRGVLQQGHAPYTNVLLTDALLDTEAVLDHRLGENDDAIRLDLPLVFKTRQAGSHLATFVESAWHQRGLSVDGEAGLPPVLSIGHGVLRLTRDAPVTSQTDVLALLHRNNVLVGILRFQLIPGFSGTQILPLPSNEGAPSLGAPPVIWTDGQSRIDIAWMSGSGCACRWPSLVPRYFPYQAVFAVPGKES